MSSSTGTSSAIPKKVMRLAGDIDKFLCDYDSYGYWDDTADRGTNILHLAGNIVRGRSAHLMEYLQIIILEDDRKGETEKAKRLLCRLRGAGAAEHIASRVH